jgi:hypothetical protein
MDEQCVKRRDLHSILFTPISSVTGFHPILFHNPFLPERLGHVFIVDIVNNNNNNNNVKFTLSLIKLHFIKKDATGPGCQFDERLTWSHSRS